MFRVAMSIDGSHMGRPWGAGQAWVSFPDCYCRCHQGETIGRRGVQLSKHSARMPERQAAKPAIFRHFFHQKNPHKPLPVEWNVDRRSSATTVRTGQLGPSPPQTARPPDTTLLGAACAAETPGQAQPSGTGCLSFPPRRCVPTGGLPLCNNHVRALWA